MRPLSGALRLRARRRGNTLSFQVNDLPPVRFDDMVTRRAGSRRFLDVHMHVPASWTLGRAAALRGEVEQALMSEVAGLRASIQLLPSNVEPVFKAVEASP